MIAPVGKSTQEADANDDQESGATHVIYVIVDGDHRIMTWVYVNLGGCETISIGS